MPHFDGRKLKGAIAPQHLPSLVSQSSISHHLSLLYMHSSSALDVKLHFLPPTSFSSFHEIRYLISASPSHQYRHQGQSKHHNSLSSNSINLNIWRLRSKVWFETRKIRDKRWRAWLASISILGLGFPL